MNNNWFEQFDKYSKVIDRLGITQAQYLSLMASVKRVFPQEWVSNELEKHQGKYAIGGLMPSLFSRLQYNPVPVLLGVKCGGFGLVSLVRLGQLIQAFENEASKEQLFKKLRGAPDDYVSALFELEVFEAFKKAGYSLMKPIESDGVDFTFKKNDKVILIEATHRGASEIMDYVNKIVKKLLKKGFHVPSNQFISLKLKYKPKYQKNELEKIIEGIMVAVSKDFSNEFKGPRGNFSIYKKKSEHGGFTIGWHYQGGEYAYEIEQLFRNKLKEKRPQLLKNYGSYCAVDMRSLMPDIVEWRKNDESSKIFKSLISYSYQFFRENPTFGGIFIWVRHEERGKDTIVGQMDQNEIIFINAPDKISEEEALQLFPFAKIPGDLRWYHTS